MKLKFSLTVFCCGAIVMIFELLAVRLLAPYYGTSLLVWTSIIGIILASLTLGNFLGGYIADRKPESKILAYELSAAAIFISISAALSDYLLPLLSLKVPEPEFGATLAVILVCTPASIFLATIPPIALKLSLADTSSSGRDAGRIFGLSSAGSILGTFLAGFYLIPTFGTVQLLALLALLLVLLASLYLASIKWLLVFVIFILALLFNPFRCFECHSKNSSIEFDTLYSRVKIVDHKDFESSRQVRSIVFDPFAWQGAVFLDAFPKDAPAPVDWRFTDEHLVIPYTKFFRMSKAFNPQIKRILMIGGCVMTIPRDLLRQFPEAKLDLVEIDPKLISLAKDYFSYKDDQRIRIFYEDGRTFINRAFDQRVSAYDLIVVDAFTSAFAIPFQLTTVEAIERLHSILSPNGVVMLNTISAITGEAGKFLRAEYKTYRTKFSQIELFPVRYPVSGELAQNIILVAFKERFGDEFRSASPEILRYLKNRWEKNIELDQEILTDNFAPVESLSLPIIRQSARIGL